MKPLRAVLLVMVAAAMIFPLFWQGLTSLKTRSEIWHAPPVWWPAEGLSIGKVEGLSFPAPRCAENYVSIFTREPFGRYLLNSLVVAGATTLLCLLIASLTAYALARLRFRGRDVVLALLLAVSMFPQTAIAPMLFLMLRAAHLIDTYPALILPYTTFTLPLAVWNLTTFFRRIPTELFDSAQVDGAGLPTLMTRIVLPLAAPAMATTAILTFIAAWNEFLFALFFTTSQSMRTVPVGISLFAGEYEAPWGQIAAATVLVSLPLMLAVFAAQRYIVSGLTSGAVNE